FTVLMMGCDARPGDETSRSDTLMVAYVDLDKNIVRLVSIPRDTYITIPTSGERTKINHAYAYGGIELTEETLKYNFDIDIDYTAEVDFQGFIDIIDALGGVTIDVPMDMYYPAEGIDLKAGVQTLDGEQSLAFCRFRSDGQGDLGRVERQQLFMTTLKDQVMSVGTVLKIPDICSAIKKNIVTNLTGTQLLQIFMDLSEGFELIPLEPEGEGRYMDDISYYFLYEESSEELIESLNNFEPTPQELAADAEQNAAAEGSEGDPTGEDNTNNSQEESNAQ
ncbi:MAG: LCP family protein, partial [Bacillota bacterium]|nr:LCP family protein [Bacillota bacterium]